jgi:hypothetical protein
MNSCETSQSVLLSSYFSRIIFGMPLITTLTSVHFFHCFQFNPKPLPDLDSIVGDKSSILNRQYVQSIWWSRSLHRCCLKRPQCHSEVAKLIQSKGSFLFFFRRFRSHSLVCLTPPRKCKRRHTMFEPKADTFPLFKLKPLLWRLTDPIPF